VKVFFLMLLMPFTALAAGEPTVAAPKEVVQDIFTRAGVAEVATDAKKQAEVNELVDFDALARAALGKQKVAEADFAWFRDTLKEIIARTVYPKAPDFLKDVKITYSADEVKDGKAKVKSTVQNKADLTDVDYQLANEGGKGWKVTDVSISGQSWVESIREEVGKVIKKSKWAGLKTKMQKRLNDLKTGKA
jgi:ABC-type transporter MlaC component